MWAAEAETGHLPGGLGGRGVEPLHYKSARSSAAAAVAAAPSPPSSSSSSSSSPHTRSSAAMSHVDVKNLKPSTFEEEYYDQYEYYNLTDKYTEGSARKGRTKKEASDNTNRPNPGGHERKITEKLQNSERKEKE